MRRSTSRVSQPTPTLPGTRTAACIHSAPVDVVCPIIYKGFIHPNSQLVRGLVHSMLEYFLYLAMGHNLWLHVGVDEHPFATYFDVHQGYRVLTHSHLSLWQLNN